MLSLSKHLYLTNGAVEMLRQAQHDVLLVGTNSTGFLVNPFFLALFCRLNDASRVWLYSFAQRVF
jgi:hypothetical protein